MYYFIKLDGGITSNITPCNASLVSSATPGAVNISVPDVVLRDKYAIRAVMVTGSSATPIATTGYTCKLSIGLAGATAMLEVALVATTDPAGYEAVVDFGDADIISAVGALPYLDVLLCIRIYNASLFPQTILLMPMRILNPVQSPA